MTDLTIRFQSYCLGKSTTVHVILPTIMNPLENPGRISFKGPFRTLYFLHGAQDDPGDVIARTRIGDYAMENNLAVILPEGDNAFYLDLVPGFGYESFVTDELIEATRELLPLFSRSQRNVRIPLSAATRWAATGLCAHRFCTRRNTQRVSVCPARLRSSGPLILFARLLL